MRTYIWRYLDSLKAFGHIERVVEYEIHFWKRPILLHMCATCSKVPSYISTMIVFRPKCMWSREILTKTRKPGKIVEFETVVSER